MRKSKGNVIMALAISIIAIFIMFAIESCSNSFTEYEWNNGICNNCNVRYELRGATNNGAKYYACPECGNEVKRY